MNRPDFSAAMLRSFLQIRVHFEDRTAYRPGRDTQRIEKEKLRRDAGVTAQEFNRAWRGWTLPSASRARLWAALGVYPGLSGVVLTDDGGQEACTLPSLAPSSDPAGHLLPAGEKREQAAVAAASSPQRGEDSKAASGEAERLAALGEGALSRRTAS